MAVRFRHVKDWLKSCDNCNAQEGRHYCLLHGVQVKNMDIKRCKDFEEKSTEKERKA